MPQLVQTKGLGEDVGSLSIRRNILKFDFTRKDTLSDEMVVHLNVLGPRVKNWMLLDVVTVDRRRIGHLLL